jgi:hypothetical protein
MTSGKPAKENGKLSWLRDHAQAVCAKPSETHMAQGRASDTRAHFQLNTRAHALVHAHIDSHRNAQTQNARARAHRSSRRRTRAHTHARTTCTCIHSNIRARTHALTQMRCCSTPHLPAIFARVRKSHLGVRRSRSLQEQQEGRPSSF